ncbi:metal-binding domain containing of MaoC dehydratase [Oceanicola sp. 22II-s10i]|uniref:FAS1-like dehydratase domain-containing protein n=1 Tax=Oceanicola sp. 22II-s10i TaxID=1317116 RepID=UPI000B52274E|nr:MaoC family dehydratase N-terminal domain-containing protein [Oceanicola sp. 22II-s10i]OWU84710.1 metal-binding domain containing of MaoC dehydratase [Oceanicola sp. 22II-s10i]
MDISHLRTWIGRQERMTGEMSGHLAAQFNATFDDATAPATGAPAPLLAHYCIAQPIVPTSGLGEDGHPARGGFLPPVPLPRRMWAAASLDFHAPIRVGDLVERTSTIQNVEVKEGRSGRLCFVTVGHDWAVAGETRITEVQHIVYRDATAPANAARQRGEDAAPQGAHVSTVRPSATQLFRYSAVTFNSHRIHYDLPYVREEEHYPGLIVQGPMQATMLIRLAEELRGSAPRRFSFRSLSPVFDTADFTLNATPDGDRAELWTASVGGPVGMKATAEW